MQKKFPFWLIPFTLFLFIAVLFLILYFNNKLWFFDKYFKTTVKDKNYNDYTPERKDIVSDDFLVASIKKEEDKLKISQDNKLVDLRKDISDKNLTDEIENKFRKGIDFFKSGQYKYSVEVLEEYLRLTKNDKNRLKSYFYIAYAKMFDGIKNNNNDLIEESRNFFIKVYKSINKESDIFSKTIIGLARTSRLLKNYPEKIDDLLKEAILIEKDDRVKKVVFYEISLYYLYNNDFKKFVMYIERSGNSIKEMDIINTILEQPLSSISIVSLIEKNILNFNYFPYLKYRMQEKMFNDAKTFYYNNQKEESLYILKKIITLFPYEPIVEDANYFIATIYHKEMEFDKAIYYYDQVLSNQYPDYDPAALFRKGIIYYRQGNYKMSKECFLSITTDFVSSNYYRPAKDWLKEIEKVISYKKDIENLSNKNDNTIKKDDSLKNENKNLDENKILKPKEDDGDINIFDDEDNIFTK
ncbi:MAG TPA: hypothetical protein PKW55_01330 [Spirochaetota bacterium]|nr:hypothetical protein [Spirochaetota bacterium]HOM38867.1 hypothetical protein [Spirochaetota bacterium]HPQ49162.1 hypothetical protein [Spirochaetota bacterium]